MARFLIDTNVMLAASAVLELSNVATRAMPREIELRQIVYEWLVSFEQSNDRIVIDDLGLVRKEYERNMPFEEWHAQEYGIQVLQNKFDRNLVDEVPIDDLEANGEHIAILAPEHEKLVSDREDRKWVACALSTLILHDESPPIVYGAETDWYIAKDQLERVGIRLHPLLPNEWYEARVNPS
jgi:predicted nucleic acid-binding protein